MIPIETLKHEHQVILMVLDAAEREIQSIQDTGRAHAEAIGQMVGFFKDFADRCHHAKEEDLLFARMQERGVPAQDGPIAVMLTEHDEGCRRVRNVAEALPQAAQGDAQAVTAVRNNLALYVELVRAHIDKEDHILYPMADRLFTPEDHQALTEAFEQVEAKGMGEGVHGKYHRPAHELAGRGA